MSELDEAWEALFATYEHVYHGDRPPSVNAGNLVAAAKRNVLAAAALPTEEANDG